MKLNLKKTTFLAGVFALIMLCACLFNANVASAEAERRYCGYGSVTPYALESTTETVNYTKREYVYIETVKGVPLYMPIANLENGCGAIAGSIIVGFYDKYYEELIPNYTTYIRTGRYRGADGTYIPQTMRELYTLMRTNVDDVGVSESDCVNGLRSYILNKGYNASLTSIRNGNVVDEASFTAAVSQNKPVLLFCDKLETYGIISTDDTSDKVVRTIVTSSCHVAVGYGVYIINYYNGDTIFRTDRYLQVATGLSNIPDYFLKFDETDWCNGAYVVSVS